MSRGRHPKKEVEEALAELEASGDWIVTETAGRGHWWGVAKCVFGHGPCQISIWSTPRSPGNHAKQILRVATRCSNGEES